MSPSHRRVGGRRPTKGTVGAALGVACVLTVGVSAAPAASTSTTALKAALKGSNETKPGDPDGLGTATVRITGTRLCYSLSLSKVVPEGGHIHRGKAGADGPIVVKLFTGKVVSKRCVTVAAPLARQIAMTPGGFYVNLHNAKYPDGAVRGQLRKG